MKHSQEKAAGVSHPPAAQMESQSLGDAATLADPRSTGFDNLHGIPQTLQAGAACGQYGSGGTVPNVAPAATVPPAVGKQHKRKDPFAGMFGGEGQPAEQTWGKPLPLRTSVKALPYPIEVLPPLIRNAIKEVEEFTQAPTAMIAASALAAVSTTVQGLVSVERGEGLRGPASLYFLTLAVSGERKTSADKYFTKAIGEWESEQAEAAKPALAEHRARATEWQCTEEGYKQAIKKNAASGAMLDRHHADLLKQLELNKPIEPRVPAVLRMDDTPESLGVALTRWPVAAVMSNEAGIIFGAHGMNPESVMRNMAGLNVCWDGGHLKRDRTSTQSINVEGMRVTVGLQVQPDTLQAFLNKQGALARGIGFLARFLVAHPESTQGTRFYREQKQGAPALTAFNARAKQLLGCPAQVDVEGRLSTTYLTLSPEAKETWVRFHDEVEEELGRGRDYYDVQDVASKAADNAARLAACLHTFSDHTGITVIGADSMEAGAELMRWYLFESLRFCRQVAIPEGLRKAEMLEEWLIEKLRDGMPLVPTRVVSQMAPNPIRKAADRDAAIDILEAHNRAKVFEYGQKKEISLNPEVVNEYRR